MSEHCETCKNWIKRRQRTYSDGTNIMFFWVAPPNGLCEKLSQETEPSFFCSKYEAAPDWDHVSIENIEGAPWQNFKMGTCPDCKGRGSGEFGGACGRCVGTGQVRYYDDGFVGEEKTRRHPKEPTTDTPVVDPGIILAPVEKPSII